jgi:MYXO-CTERM domain-containing protein
LPQVSPDLNGKNWQATAMFDNISVTAVPEPSVALLGALGLLGFLRRRRG